MSDRNLALRVGALIAAAVLVLAAFLFVLGGISFRPGYQIYVDYNFVANLRPKAPVKVAGIKVGRVEEIEYLGGRRDAKTGRPVYVRVTLRIEKRVQDSIKGDSEFYINTAGVLGEQYVEIVPGSEAQPLAAQSVVSGMDPPRTDLVVARLYDVLEALSAVLHEDRDSIKNLLRNSASAVASLDQFLTDNRSQLGELVASAHRFAGSASNVLDTFDRGLGDPRIIGQTLRDADALLVTANRSLETLTPPAAAFFTQSARVAKIVDEKRVDRAFAIAEGTLAVATKAGGVIDKVDGLVTDMRRGRGTAGALLVREDLYADLREMIRDLKRNPWKFFWKE